MQGDIIMAKKQIITVVWIDSVGNIVSRSFTVIKTENNIIYGQFADGKKLGFSSKNVKNGIAFVFENNKKQLHILDPNEWRNIPLKDYDIKEYRFNLRNFREQESVSSINRWTLPKTNLEKLLPIFRMMIITICIGALGYFAFKFAGIVLNDSVSPLKTACNIIIPPAPVPIDVPVINGTAVPIY